MTLNWRNLTLLAALGSLGLLAGAFFFQALGWAPCKLCLWQRWPHAVAIVIGLVGFWLGFRVLAWAGALAALTAAGLAAYHTGVEQKWWEGPTSCTGNGGLGGLDSASLLPGAAAEAPAVVLCDKVTPFFLGLTMANWNLIASTVLVVIWIWAALRAK